jgi:hypothetical protein
VVESVRWVRWGGKERGREIALSKVIWINDEGKDNTGS